MWECSKQYAIAKGKHRNFRIRHIKNIYRRTYGSPIWLYANTSEYSAFLELTFLRLDLSFRDSSDCKLGTNFQGWPRNQTHRFPSVQFDMQIYLKPAWELWIPSHFSKAPHAVATLFLWRLPLRRETLFWWNDIKMNVEHQTGADLGKHE